MGRMLEQAGKREDCIDCAGLVGRVLLAGAGRSRIFRTQQEVVVLPADCQRKRLLVVTVPAPRKVLRMDSEIVVVEVVGSSLAVAVRMSAEVVAAHSDHMRGFGHHMVQMLVSLAESLTSHRVLHRLLLVVAMFLSDCALLDGRRWCRSRCMRSLLCDVDRRIWLAG